MDINFTPEYLRSQRTLSATEVDDRAHARAQHAPAPADRFDGTTHHAEFSAARH